MGGPGRDLVDYSASPGAVTVTLGGTGNDGAGSYDAVGADVERVAGSTFDDLLLGGVGADELVGAGGDDTLDGRSGADVLAGGPGDDRASYERRVASVAVSLDGAANDW